jgi:Uma2 family endonuclease
MTADALLEMREDEWRYELVRGELVRRPLNGERHGRVAAELMYCVGTFERGRRLGELYSRTGFLLERDPDTVRAADLSFVKRERVVRTTGYPPLAPDLAAEVVDDADLPDHMAAKVTDFLNAGTRLVWLCYPGRPLFRVLRADGSISELGRNDTLSGEDVLPGFAMKVADLFATS